MQSLNFFTIIVTFIILNLFLFFFHKKLSNIYGIQDYPDNKRKIHSCYKYKQSDGEIMGN